MPPEKDNDIEVCRRHRQPAQQAHGLVTGPIPPQKLLAFRRAARLSRSSDPPTMPPAPSNPEHTPPSGNDDELTPGEQCPRTPGNDAGENASDQDHAFPECLGTPNAENEIISAVFDNVEDLFAQSDSEEYDGNVPLVPCFGCGNAKLPVDACLCEDCPLRGH